MKWLLPFFLSVAHGATTEPERIVSAGASFPLAAYNDMFRSWSLIQDKTVVSYEPTGSGTGKARIIANIVDFAGSDSRLKAKEYAQVPDLQMLPMLASAIAVAVNIPELEDANEPVVLSSDALGGIYGHKILMWDDPIIKKDNPDSLLPHKEIQILTSPDKSGLTSIFTSFLSRSTELWEHGSFNRWTDKFYQYDNFHLIKYKYTGISAHSFSQPYTITYMPYYVLMAWPTWRVASIVNNDGEAMRPDSEYVVNAMSQAKFDERFNADIFGLDGHVYPLAALTYLVVRKNATDTSEKGCAHRANVLRVLQWMYTSDTAENAALKNGFVTLPESVREDVIEILANIRCNDEFSLKQVIRAGGKKGDDGEVLICPQLPKSAPVHLAEGRTWRAPPQGWSCKPELYYELDGLFAESATCDCGCGVIDPDCGYVQTTCETQTWEPKYAGLTCEGKESEMDLLYCRIESATCQQLPPGLARGKTAPWTCIPDFYNELSDPGTKRNDCDCNCNGEDPDCFSNYNKEYCPGITEENEDGILVAKPLRGSAYTCAVNKGGTTCVLKEKKETKTNRKVQEGEEEGEGLDVTADYPNCPQLPDLAPAQLAAGHINTEVPTKWTCAPEKYYELMTGADSFSCDCGCGVIDPDCGYILKSCNDQTWNPMYTTLNCNGIEHDPDLAYCRLESATCNLLPPGLARGKTSEWKCIPDVYNEMSDSGTSTRNCDCNCGGYDPDCNAEYESIYCAEADGNPIPHFVNISCGVSDNDQVVCMQKDSLFVPLQACNFGMSLETQTGICEVESWVVGVGVAAIFLVSMIFACTMSSGEGRTQHSSAYYDKKKKKTSMLRAEP